MYIVEMRRKVGGGEGGTVKDFIKQKSRRSSVYTGVIGRSVELQNEQRFNGDTQMPNSRVHTGPLS